MENHNEATSQGKKLKKLKNESPAEQAKGIKWVKIGAANSEIAIWHRPSKIHIQTLQKTVGLTLVLTLLCEREAS